MVPLLPALGIDLIPEDSQRDGWAASGRWLVGIGCLLSGSWRGLMRAGAGSQRPCGGFSASKEGEREAGPQAGFALIALFAWQPFWKGLMSGRASASSKSTSTGR